MRRTGTALIFSLMLTKAAFAAPVGVDGAIGAEWSSTTPEVVGYDIAAPLGNFGAPGTTNHVVAYDVYFRTDGTYVYVAVDAKPTDAAQAAAVAGVNFSNLYFGLAQAGLVFGGSVGFEVTNQRAFRPGVPTGGPANDGYYPYTPAGSDIHFASSLIPDVIEFAAPISFFTTDPLGAGFSVATTAIRLSQSQSFGYSAAGGNAYGVPDRLGIVALAAPVPAPATAALLAIGVAGVLTLRRRRD